MILTDILTQASSVLRGGRVNQSEMHFWASQRDHGNVSEISFQRWKEFAS
jgi:hypothetical protein